MENIITSQDEATNEVKLICCDIDGTLLNKQREVDHFTKKIFGLINKETQIILASSRMPKALYHIQNDLSIIGAPIICYNGGLILSGGKDFTEDQVVASFTIPTGLIKNIISLSNKLQVHASIYYNNTWIASALDDWTKREINNTKVEPDYYFDANFADEVSENIKYAHKIMVMGDPEKISLIEQQLLSDKKVALCRSKDTYLEITPFNTNKSEALSSLIKSIKMLNNISKDNIMAFGDNHNDFELLRDVKYGIAVGNAVGPIKNVAYAIAKNNVDNGVAHYINEFYNLT